MAGLAALAAGICVLLIAISPPAQADSGSLQQRIDAGQGRISALSGAVGAASSQVHRLTGSIGALQARIARVQADLAAKRAELLRLRTQLAAARARLRLLEATEAHDEAVLRAQLVGAYEQGQPDIVNVVLESHGFSDLLERLAFAQRVSRSDAQIVASVRAARRAVAAEAVRLGALTVRQQSLTMQVLNERNSLDRTRVELVSAQLAAVRRRNAAQGQLNAVRAHVAFLRGQLARLQAAQARAAAAAASQSSPGSSGSSSGSSGSGSAPSGAPAPAPQASPPSSGGFTFPMPKGSVSPPSTWSLDDGVDIAAPGGTPEYAVCSGTVVLHGIGGFGPSAPVIHCDSPLAGYDYVYYGHAGPGNWVPVGTHLSQGQVISEVGFGIVGISTGPHLEIGFADSSGSPIGPSSAPAMMSLLQSAYGG